MTANSPDFNRVIPLDNDKIFLVSRTQLLGALERAAILANEKFRGARLFLQPGLLSVVCSNNEQEEAREELEIAYQGGELEVGFNIGYLMDVLRNIHSDDMQLAFGDANRSTLFTVPNNPNFKYIVIRCVFNWCVNKQKERVRYMLFFIGSNQKAV